MTDNETRKINFNVRLDAAVIDHLKREAIQASNMEGDRVSVADLIRRSIETLYPFNTETDNGTDNH